MGWILFIIVILVAWYFLSEQPKEEEITIVGIFLIIGLWIYIWDFPNAGWADNKIIAYPVICSGNFSEFKPSLRFDKKTGKVVKIENPAKNGNCYEGTEKAGRFNVQLSGRVSPGDPIIYIIRPESSKVSAMAKGQNPYTLENCNILDNENWNCPLGPTVLNGEFKSNPNGKIKYVPQWRYRWTHVTHWFSKTFKEKTKETNKVDQDELNRILNKALK